MFSPPFPRQPAVCAASPRRRQTGLSACCRREGKVSDSVIDSLLFVASFAAAEGKSKASAQWRAGRDEPHEEMSHGPRVQREFPREEAEKIKA